MTTNFAIPTPEMQGERRADQERKRKEILQRRRAKSDPAPGAPGDQQSPALRLPTEEELEDALLKHEGDPDDGVHSLLDQIRIPPYEDGTRRRSRRYVYGQQVGNDVVLITHRDQRVAHGARIRLVCVHADAFESVDAIVAWFEEWEPYLEEMSVMLPRYWVVGSKRLDWPELVKLNRIGASYEQLHSHVVDVPKWLEEQFPTSPGEYHPPSPQPPVQAVPYSGNGTSSLDSWERDREESARAHVRGLRRKDELLSRSKDGENRPK